MSIVWQNWGLALATNGQGNVDEEPDATLPLAEDSGVELAYEAEESQCCFDAESADHNSQVQVDLDSQVQVEVQDSKVQVDLDKKVQVEVQDSKVQVDLDSKMKVEVQDSQVSKKRTVASPETGQKKKMKKQRPPVPLFTDALKILKNIDDRSLGDSQGDNPEPKKKALSEAYQKAAQYFNELDEAEQDMFLNQILKPEWYDSPIESKARKPWGSS